MNLANTVAEKAIPENEHANDVVIRSYTSIGIMQGIGKVEVEAREIVVPDRRHVAYFVKVAVETMGDYPQTSATLIQYENIPKLLSSIEKLASSVIKTDRFSFSEVEYEVDNLKIIVFNDGRGKNLFVISIDNISIHFNAQARLIELRDLLAKAKRHLDLHKVEF